MLKPLMFFNYKIFKYVFGLILKELNHGNIRKLDLKREYAANPVRPNYAPSAVSSSQLTLPGPVRALSPARALFSDRVREEDPLPQ